MDVRTLDHAVLAVLVALTTVLLITTPISPLVGSLLYFGLPSAYLVFRRPCIFKVALVPALVFGTLYSLGFEYISEVSNAWIFPLADAFVLPSLFFGVVSGDLMLWYFLWVFTIIVYYEYFIDRGVCDFTVRHIRSALALGILGLGIIAIAHYGFNTQITLFYSYAILGVLALLPALILHLRSPHLFRKLIQSVPFLALFFLVMELTALHVGYWAFTGNYLAVISLAGHVIPLEELLFWIFGSPIIIVAYHELFLDDGV